MFLLITGLLLGLCVYKREIISEKYHKFQSLNRVVKTTHKNENAIKANIESFIESCKIALEMYWILFMQWCNSSVKWLNKNTFSVKYVLNGHEYIFISNSKRGPHKYYSIRTLNKDEKNNMTEKDVTDIILPYLGPKEDWHGRKFKPSFWNMDSLIFYDNLGRATLFEKDDVIDL